MHVFSSSSFFLVASFVFHVCFCFCWPPTKKAVKSTTGVTTAVIAEAGDDSHDAKPLASSELDKDTARVAILWESRTVGGTFWLEHLATMMKEYKDRFDLTMILSRCQHQDAICGVAPLYGRITPTVLHDVFDRRWGTEFGGTVEAERDAVRFVSVGTKSMMNVTDRMLAEIGYPQPRHALLTHCPLQQSTMQKPLYRIL